MNIEYKFSTAERQFRSCLSSRCRPRKCSSSRPYASSIRNILLYTLYRILHYTLCNILYYTLYNIIILYVVYIALYVITANTSCFGGVFCGQIIFLLLARHLKIPCNWEKGKNTFCVLCLPIPCHSVLFKLFIQSIWKLTFLPFYYLTQVYAKQTPVLYSRFPLIPLDTLSFDLIRHTHSSHFTLIRLGTLTLYSDLVRYTHTLPLFG